jgi:parallel beta-helix repeat protein
MTHAGAHPESGSRPPRDRRRPIARRRRRLLSVILIAALAAAGSVVVAVRFVPAVPPPTTEPGAAKPGSVSYEVPAHALFVAPTGSDSAVGSLAHPLLTVQRAITVATSGQTIVLRGGTYHQRTTVTSDKTVTIQPYRREAVWFDGSSVVGNWQRDGTAWVTGGWDTRFDSSPTFERGAPDNTEPGYVFLNPAHPLAAHPDQLWIDGHAQIQVATAAEVRPGDFAVDDAAGRLYLGSDPTGHEVRASDKVKAFSIQSKDTVLRGFGVRRYATSVPGFGAITIEAPGGTVDNLLIENNATTGLFIGAANTTVTRVTVRDNGMMGMGANYADGLRVTGLVSTGNNTEHFNNAPVSGGFKITRSRTVTIERSSIEGNFGPGLWFDQSDFDVAVIANDVRGNAGHGVSLEISAHVIVAGNRISNNRDNGIKVNDTTDVQIWNNTIVDNGRDLSVAQDLRRAADLTIPGHDPRRPQPDQELPWVVGDVTASNNIFSGATGNCVVCVEDYSGEYTAEQLGVTLDGNLYQRVGTQSPGWLIVWSHGPGNPTTFTTLAEFVSATGQETHGVSLGVASAASHTWHNAAAEAPELERSIRKLPITIRRLLGWGASENRIGAK